MKHTQFAIFLVCFALGLCACSKLHEPGCGEGSSLAFGGGSYCVYEAGIIEEGFSCPAFVPNEYDFGEFMACGAMAEPPAGLEGEVYRVFRPAGGASDAGGTCEYNGRIYQERDAFCAEDGCNTCSCFAGLVACGGVLCVSRSDSGGDASVVQVCTPGELIDNPGPVDASVPAVDANLGDGGPRGERKWHLTPIPSDTVSFVLRADMTWQIGIHGCQFRMGYYGTYEQTGRTSNQITLLPPEGEGSFPWPGSDGEASELSAIIYVDGKLAVTVNEATQTWDRGARCPVCQDNEPVGSEACDDPFSP